VRQTHNTSQVKVNNTDAHLSLLLTKLLSLRPFINSK